MTTSRLPVNLLASAIFGAGLMISGAASACTITNWLGAGSTTAPTAAEPTQNSNATPRYSGRCGLQVGAVDRFVGDNNPNGSTDGTSNPYRARFYVWTGLTSGTSTILRATSAADGGGTQAFAVKYNRDAGAFEFEYGGPANVGSIAGIVVNRWYGIELNYQGGSPLQAFVVGNGNSTEATFGAAPANAPATAVGSVVLGATASSTGVGRLAFDDFESTRSELTRIPFLCRGDANNSGTGTAVNVQDAVAIVSERVTNTLALGQPDCNEDGVINVQDAVCVVNLRLANVTCP